jgi:hypothetical protein
MTPASAWKALELCTIFRNLSREFSSAFLRLRAFFNAAAQSLPPLSRVKRVARVSFPSTEKGRPFRAAFEYAELTAR